jgi:hypothetical protein
LATGFITNEQLQDKFSALKKSVNDDTKTLIGQQCLSLSQFRDEINDLKLTFAEDLELQKATTIKQIKNDTVQERTVLKQELRADQDKANDRYRKELATTKDNLTKHQEVVRDLASKIDELHRSNEILQNYNDLPDLVESM